MTADVLDQSESVGVAVLGEQSDPGRLRHLLRHGAVAHAVRLASTGLSAALQDEVIDAVQGVAAAVLGVPTVELIVAGWRKHEELQAAAQATAGTAGLTRFVSLASHRITHIDQMTIDIVVGAFRLPPVELAFTVTADIDAALMIVTSGRLTGLRGGRCTLHATLQLAGETIADQWAHLDLRAERRFDPTYALLAATEMPTAQPAQQPSSRATGSSGVRHIDDAPH